MLFDGTMPKERVAKLVVAERQLNEAIRLFFERRDVIAVHTLASASAQVLSDLCVSKGVDSQLQRHADLFKSKEGYKRFLKIYREPENFFKHAERDPEDTFEFDSEQTRVVLVDAVLMHQALTRGFSRETNVYFTWFCYMYPEVVQGGPLEKTMSDLRSSWAIDAEEFGFFARLISESKYRPVI